MVRVPVMIANWVFSPTYVILLAFFTSDIVDTVCIPWGIYYGVAAQKSLASVGLFIGYLLPLSLMIFCYSRIVCALRAKVTAPHHRHSYMYHK